LCNGVGSILASISFRLFQFFKYCIYALFVLNVYLFLSDEHAAALVQYPDGVPAAELIGAYASSIDTAAWLILLLMFEAETSYIADRQITRPVAWTLHGLRFFCYAFIVYAFYGYIVNLQFASSTATADGISNLCDVVGGNWLYAVALDQYEQITEGNCATFSSASDFYRYLSMPVLVDLHTYQDLLRLAWVDVINSAMWLLVVVNLEIDVRLQERGKFDGLILRISNVSKFFIYSVLFLAAVYWGFKGDFVDFWDAFLWLVAFVFIEMNVFSLRQDTLRDSTSETLPQT
jgi:hypothetical protein